MKSGVEIIGEERKRQIEVEGFDAKHDDQEPDGALSKAAARYALWGLHIPDSNPILSGLAAVWPWDIRSWKPSTRLRNLAKAGALIAAEIDKLVRKHGDPPAHDAPEPDGGDPLATVVVGVIGVVVVAVVVYATVQMAPIISNWLSDQRTPKPEQEIVCVDPAIPSYCSGYAQERVDAALAAAALSAPTCQMTCEPGFVFAEQMDPEAVPDYLAWADSLIADMNEAAGVYSSLRRVVLEGGSTRASRDATMQRALWITLRDDFDRRVRGIHVEIEGRWSPSPSTSNNPLLDAHARLLMAYLFLDQARDVMWQAVLHNESSILESGSYYLDKMRDQINLAQVFGLGAMR